MTETELKPIGPLHAARMNLDAMAAELLLATVRHSESQLGTSRDRYFADMEYFGKLQLDAMEAWVREIVRDEGVRRDGRQSTGWASGVPRG